ncbi:hypothetical protein SBF1_2480005 [Candidatus Desulfosporosinus infrequens]|uniref:Uncharacterized protein n=1 Tax=Candidatus Desulfosporosinus infrequens TaxID=2043169 RepID=A0A2U3KNW3_9FIRM|nr:hypothetical protein SBF1_2480005 [Candidatus Desulfosporosinus infrequens]
MLRQSERVKVYSSVHGISQTHQISVVVQPLMQYIVCNLHTIVYNKEMGGAIFEES